MERTVVPLLGAETIRLASASIVTGVALLGVAPVAVLIFEVMRDAVSMFAHGDVCLPVRLERVLRPFVVTPDTHRAHHSTDHHAIDSNFGFNLPRGNHMFCTYRDQPALGHQRVSLGIERFCLPRERALDRMLPLWRGAPAPGCSPVAP